MIDPVISVSLRCLLALLFATAAWHKVSDDVRFASAVDAYGLLPRWLVKSAARALPMLEITVAVLFLLPMYRLAGLAAATLLVLYSSAIAINLMRDRRDIDCGCFGSVKGVMLDTTLLVRNAVLIAGAAAVWLPSASRSLVWIDAFTIVATVTVTTLLWGSLWRLASAMEKSR